MRLLLVATILGAILSLAYAQMGGMGGMGAPPGAIKPPGAVKTDVQYIRCQACELLAKHAFRHAKSMRSSLKPGQKLSEIAVIEAVEKMHNPMKDEGEWIAHIDLVEDGSVLKVVEMEETGECGTECRTVARAVEDITGEFDTDMAELLWIGKKNRAQFTSWLCYEASGVCNTKAPKLPKDRKPGPEFKVVDEQKAQLDKMMESMRESGMGGQLYDRESMQQMAGMGEDGEEGDEDDEEEDEEGDEVKAATGGIGKSKAASGTQDILGQATVAAQAGLETAKEVITTAAASAQKVFASAVGTVKETISKWTDKSAVPEVEL